MSNDIICQVGQDKIAHLLAYHYPYKHITHVSAV